MPNIIYNVTERVWMVRARNSGLSYRRMRNHFAVLYPGRPIPSVSTIKSVVEKFQKDGNASPGLIPVHHPSRALPKEVKLAICMSVIEKPRISCASIAHKLHVNKSSVWKTLREENFFPYKNQYHQELLPGDDDRRMLFCGKMLDLLYNDGNLLYKLIVSDECTFYIDHAPNRQNVRYWAADNQHQMSAIRTQYQKAVNVWAGLVGDQVIGPYFISDRLTQDVYLSLLRDRILPAIRQLGNQVCYMKLFHQCFYYF